MKRALTLLTALLLMPAAALHANETTERKGKPNIVIILADDLGYSDFGCYGSEIDTPNIDRLAESGLRFSSYYSETKCNPSRQSLLTGKYSLRAYNGRDATIAECLALGGYFRTMVGKWDMVADIGGEPRKTPQARGFEHFFGTPMGCGSYFAPIKLTRDGEPAEHESLARDFYYTDAITDNAVKYINNAPQDKPLFLYAAYTAPHWPLQAWPEDIAKYKGVYDNGYEAVRQERYKRQVKLGLIDPKIALLPPMEIGETKPKWESLSLEERKKEAKLMEIYAAMVDRLDQNIGRLLKQIEAQGQLENTLVFFFSDNGGCAVDPKVDYEDPNASLGSVASYPSYGQNWATVSDTPLRKWKTTSHEGGINTPLIVNWPAAIKARKDWNQETVHLIDIMPTVLAVSGGNYPGESKHSTIPVSDGISLLPALKGDKLVRKIPIFFQFSKSAAVRDGDWKLVRLGPNWELYNMNKDRTETNDLIAQHPDIAKKMESQWLDWWKDCTKTEWTGKAPKEAKDE
jgi:arylsulfatase